MITCCHSSSRRCFGSQEACHDTPLQSTRCLPSTFEVTISMVVSLKECLSPPFLPPDPDGGAPPPRFEPSTESPFLEPYPLPLCESLFMNGPSVVHDEMPLPDFPAPVPSFFRKEMRFFFRWLSTNTPHASLLNIAEMVQETPLLIVPKSSPHGMDPLHPDAVVPPSESDLSSSLSHTGGFREVGAKLLCPRTSPHTFP